MKNKKREKSQNFKLYTTKFNKESVLRSQIWLFKFIFLRSLILVILKSSVLWGQQFLAGRCQFPPTSFAFQKFLYLLSFAWLLARATNADAYIRPDRNLNRLGRVETVTLFAYWALSVVYLQALLILLSFALLRLCKFSAYCKLKVCGSPESSKSTSAIFSTASAPLLSVTFWSFLQYFKLFSLHLFQGPVISDCDLQEALMIFGIVYQYILIKVYTLLFQTQCYRTHNRLKYSVTVPFICPGKTKVLI